jgi:hypothetical protein
MSTILGDKHKFATEVGEWDHELCRVDIWAAGKWLTCDDNMAFVRQFRRDVLDTAAWLRSGMAPRCRSTACPRKPHTGVSCSVPEPMTKAKPTSSFAVGSGSWTGGPRLTT